MTTELFYLTLTAILTGVLWIPAVIGMVQTRGFLAPEDYVKAPTSKLATWAERANRAHCNAVENLGPFAAVVIIAHLVGVSTGVTATAAAVYFFARLAHAIVHISGFKYLMARTVLFSVSSFSFLIFAIELLRHA